MKTTYSSTLAEKFQEVQSPKSQVPRIKVYKIPIILLLITCVILHTDYTFSQGQGQGLWNAIGQDGVTTNRQVSIKTTSPLADFDVNGTMKVRNNAIFDTSLTAHSLYSYYLSVTGNTSINQLSVGGEARFYRPTYFDSLMTANEIRVQLLGAGIIIADSAQLESVVSTFINAAQINGIDISSTKITAERINTDTVVTVVLSCGNAQFTGTVFTSDIITGNISVTGTSNLNKIIVSDEVSITSLAGSNQGLIQYDTTGKLTRLDFTSNPNEVLTGNGTFQNINTLVPRDTGWQWYDTTVLLSTAPIVAIQNNLVVGNRVSIGSLRMSNGSATDTMTTDRRFALEAAKILLKADTVQLQNYATARQITADTLTTNKYAKVGSDTSKYNPPVTGTLALEVAGSATVKGDVAVKGDIAANDLSISTAVSSPKVVTSRITSPDSLIYFGDSSMSVIINCPERILSGCRNMVMGGKPTLSQFRLGIGKLASSNYTLDVSGAVNATDYFKNGQALKEGLWNDGGSGNIYYNSGNVGIGTSQPEDKFQVGSGENRLVTGSAGYTTLGYGTSYLGFNASRSNNEWHINTDWAHNGGGVIFGSIFGDIKFAIAPTTDPGTTNQTLTDADILNNTIMTISNNGKVGIGTSNPEKELHVKTNHKSYTDIEPEELLEEGSHNGIRLEDNLDYYTGGIFTGTTTSKWDIVPAYGKLLFGTPVYPGDPEYDSFTGTKPLVVIQPDGNVGIGTNTPSEKLDVNGNIRLNENDLFFRSDVPDGNHGIGWYGVNNDFNRPFAGESVDGPVVYGFSGGALGINQWGTTQSIVLKWTSDGNVGVGTNDPKHKVDVNGHIGLVDHLVFNGTSTHGVINWPERKSLWFRTNSTPGDVSTYTTRMIITDEGDVGIGTEIPQAKLDVKGILKACSLRVEVTTGCPDFVFEDAYILPLLSEKARYIRQNKHLPYIQSAADMVKNSMDVNGTILGLLRNIEEITLYQIEHDKRMKVLEDENDRLKTELEIIKKKLNK